MSGRRASAVVRPVGPLPRRQYWRRRIGVLLGLVTVGLLLAAPPIGESRRKAAEIRSDSAVASRSGSRPAPAPPVGVADACLSSRLSVALGEGRPDGDAWLFTIRVRNDGDGACTIDLGRDVEFTVTGGTERVHRSSACEPESDPRELAAGAAVRVVARWSGRAGQSPCPGDDAGPAPAGLYVARARAGTATDTSVVEARGG